VQVVEDTRALWPLKPEVWAVAGFDKDEDWEVLQFVLSNGVPICPVDAIPPPFSSRNYKSFEEAGPCLGCYFSIWLSGLICVYGVVHGS
jgi:hypothetical protein